MVELTPQPLRVIEEVKQRPGLWKSKFSMSMEDKLEQWKQIGASMYVDWDSYSKATQYDIVLQLQSKWRSLRDGYSRELRSRKRGRRAYAKTYIYFKKLLFLGGYDGEVSSDEEDKAKAEGKKSRRRRRKPVIEMDQKTEVETKTEADEDEELQSQYIEMEFTEQSRSSTPESKPKIKSRRLTTSPKLQQMCEINVSTDTNDAHNHESDKLYLLSFLPDLSQLPRPIKMWAKTQIAQVMEQAVNHHLNGTTPPGGRKLQDPISSTYTNY